MKKNYFTDQNVVNILENNFMPYAMSVIISRAIPEIDGLSPPTENCFTPCIKWGCSQGKKPSRPMWWDKP